MKYKGALLGAEQRARLENQIVWAVFGEESGECFGERLWLY
jgi:hypothetical protein